MRFISGPPTELRIESLYRLQNSGNSELTFIDAKFPDERSFGRNSLRVEVDGREVLLEAAPTESRSSEQDEFRIPFESDWNRGQIRNLSVEYTLVSPENSGARITLGEEEFHLGSRDWFPELEPPKHLLAPSPKSSNPAAYAIRVPANFSVLARGTPRGRKKDGDEMSYEFELSKDDLPPFVVAGKYLASSMGRRSQSGVFWTLQHLPGSPAPGGEQIAAAWRALETDFGPLDRNITAPHVVESPELRGHLSGETGPAAAAFPGGAIVNPAALALGTGNAEFLDIVAHAFAHNWFGDELRPSSEAALGIGEGLPEYATIVIEEALNGAAGRRGRVTEYVRRYDNARRHAMETPLGVTMLTDPAGPRRIALAKAPLFYVALEDACGPAEFRKGLARLVALLRGEEVDYNDLRAALEQSTNRDLAAMFRLWLNGRDIPRDFRERYPLGPTDQEAAE